ncbi:MAG TPA: hypothetical protein VEH27_10495 [Methylomirabilota bacterium]|nr:hypothetical protein [Methylomirabilota bacterium]
MGDRSCHKAFQILTANYIDEGHSFHKMISAMSKDGYLGALDGAVHFTFSDASYLASIPPVYPDRNAFRNHTLATAYLRSFFKLHLKGINDGFLDAPKPVGVKFWLKK